MLRILDEAGLLLKADYQRERRQLAQQRKAAFAAPPTGPNMVWQFDFSEYETTGGGTWRVGGIADYWSKYEFGWRWSPTANQHDAIAAVELALAEAQRLLDGLGLLEHLTDPDTDEIVPITLVTDNGGPFRSFRFGAFITSRPELRHIRTRVRTPGQNGVRERAFQSLKYEHLYRQQIDDATDLVREAETFRVEFNTLRPHEALSWNRPRDVHTGRAEPSTPTLPRPRPCQVLDAGQLWPDLAPVGVGEVSEGGQVDLGLTQQVRDGGELPGEQVRDHLDLLADFLLPGLGEDRADGRGDHLGVSFGDLGQGVAHEVNAAALPAAAL